MNTAEQCGKIARQLLLQCLIKVTMLIQLLRLIVNFCLVTVGDTKHTLTCFTPSLLNKQGIKVRQKCIFFNLIVSFTLFCRFLWDCSRSESANWQSKDQQEKGT